MERLLPECDNEVRWFAGFSSLPTLPPLAENFKNIHLSVEIDYTYSGVKYVLHQCYYFIKMTIPGEKYCFAPFTNLALPKVK